MAEESDRIRWRVLYLVYIHSVWSEIRRIEHNMHNNSKLNPRAYNIRILEQ